MKIIILTILASVVFVGCVPKEEVDVIYFEETVRTLDVIEYATPFAIVDLQSQIDQLKEHLGVVDYTGIKKDCGVHFDSLIFRNMATENDREKFCTQTYLTSDPLKVEWVELECGHRVQDVYRCNELKNLL